MASSDAADTAAEAQTNASNAGISEQRRQFDNVQKMLSPYAQAGAGALEAQQHLAGLAGQNAQQQAIDALMKGPQFTSMLAQGENSILSKASATGGLRGGNTQAALAQFSPQLLAATINDQYSRLGDMVRLGQNSAAGVGQAGLSTGNQVTNLLMAQGSANAGNALAQGRAQAGVINGVATGIGGFAANGGFGSFGGSYTTPNAFGSYSNPSGGGTGIDPFGYLGGASTAGDFSDVRLKTDIEPLGLADNGLPLYSFRYVWSGAKRIGHMAHEVLAKFPAAVSRHASGYLVVDYNRLA